MMDFVDIFIKKVSDNSKLQKKYLENWSVTDIERSELNIILQFFVEELHYDLDFITNAYLFINSMVMEETYYFIKHGKYRYTTFKEVEKIVYDNPEYMEKYMMGLCISDYVWVSHIKMLRYFEKNISTFAGKRYLEIGPGFGQYLVKALLSTSFEKYYACDISKTSVDRSNKYLKFRKLEHKCVVIEKDCFEYVSDKGFDCIVMGEVLEHVEQPLLMLKRIYSLLIKGGMAFITTVINAPALDHISLFTSVEEVLDLAKEAGFKIADNMYATEGDISLEKAVLKKQAINIAMLLEK